VRPANRHGAWSPMHSIASVLRVFTLTVRIISRA
jgi:hypothetical protein